MEHSPLKATIFSAVVPGTGQLYNGKWWKTGIAWAGLGTCVYFVNDNSKTYKYYKQQYIFQNDGDSTTVATIPNGDYFSEQERWHKYLDISYMCLAGVYILQIIDANVDSHLYYFDVGDDLSFSFHPSLIEAAGVHGGLGFTLRF